MQAAKAGTPRKGGRDTLLTIINMLRWGDGHSISDASPPPSTCLPACLLLLLFPGFQKAEESQGGKEMLGEFLQPLLPSPPLCSSLNPESGKNSGSSIAVGGQRSRYWRCCNVLCKQSLSLAIGAILGSNSNTVVVAAQNGSDGGWEGPVMRHGACNTYHTAPSCMTLLGGGAIMTGPPSAKGGGI